jgi:hypothetical protein
MIIFAQRLEQRAGHKRADRAEMIGPAFDIPGDSFDPIRGRHRRQFEQWNCSIIERFLFFVLWRILRLKL